MKLESLELLGLSNEESLLYHSLCKQPLATIADLAKVTKLHRPRVYQLLPGLIEKGIVKERTVGKRTKYVPVEPVELYDLLTQQQQKLGTVIDELQVVYEAQTKKPDIEFYVGSGGYKKLFDDIAAIVPKGGQILRYSARRPDDTSYKSSPAYRDRRNKGHFERLAITSVAKGKVANLKRLDKFVKVIPESYDAFEDHVSQTIYEDRVVFVDHENETTFIIKSEKIAAVQKKLFKLLWKFLEEPKQS